MAVFVLSLLFGPIRRIVLLDNISFFPFSPILKGEETRNDDRREISIIELEKVRSVLNLSVHSVENAFVKFVSSYVRDIRRYNVLSYS